jgi:hypothetical protein
LLAALAKARETQNALVLLQQIIPLSFVHEFRVHCCEVGPEPIHPIVFIGTLFIAEGSEDVFEDEFRIPMCADRLPNSPS